MSDKEINDVMLFKELENQKKAQADGMAAGGDMGMGMAGDMGMGGAIPTDMGSPAPDMGAAAAPAPTADIPLNQEAIVNMFGKEFLLENKDDFFKLIKASKDYIEEKSKPKVMVEEEEVDANSLMEGIRKVLNHEKPRVAKNKALHLFYEGELSGLSYDDGTFRVFGNPKKKTGRKVPGQSDIIYTEEVISIRDGKKKKKQK